MPRVHSLGRVFDEERRLVVRRHALGDPHVRPPAAVRRTDRRPGRRQLRPVLPRGRQRQPRRGQGGARTAGQLSPRDLRPDGRVLEPRRVTETDVPRGAHVPAAEEHGLQRCRRTSNAFQKRCSMRLTTSVIGLLFSLGFLSTMRSFWDL